MKSTLLVCVRDLQENYTEKEREIEKSRAQAASWCNFKKQDEAAVAVNVEAN